MIVVDRCSTVFEWNFTIQAMKGICEKNTTNNKNIKKEIKTIKTEEE